MDKDEMIEELCDNLWHINWRRVEAGLTTELDLRNWILTERDRYLAMSDLQIMNMFLMIGF